MFRKLVCAMFVMTIAIGVTFADFNATITKVDGSKVTIQKYKKVKGKAPEKDGDATTIDVGTAKVVKGTFNKDTKKLEAGDAIEGGLKAEIFAKIGEKGVQARFIEEGDKVTTIMILGGKKKKDKN